MQASDIPRAIAAARAAAMARGIAAADAEVLNSSNKLTVRLLPGDAVARIARSADRSAWFEVELAQRLAAAGCPVGELLPTDGPQVHEIDGFVITLWAYYAPVTSREITAAEYAEALVRLHAGMRTLDVPSPHMTDRVDDALAILTDPDRSPALPEPDRVLLRDTLTELGRRVGGSGRDQLLHGEPHPGNVLLTGSGVVFIDLETCCRGPVEFDLAHAPADVAEHYPDADPVLLEDCRLLMLAMVTTWRWDRDDDLPDGRRLGEVWIAELRAGLARR